MGDGDAFQFRWGVSPIPDEVFPIAGSMVAVGSVEHDRVKQKQERRNVPVGWLSLMLG